MDTGAWIALFNRSDTWHEAAEEHYRGLLESRTALLTTNYVVAETATRLRGRAGLDRVLAFRTALKAAATQRLLRVKWIDPRLDAEGWDILERYRDVSMSLTDATTVVVAQREHVSHVFGFDSDFRAAGLDVRPGS